MEKSKFTIKQGDIEWVFEIVIDNFEYDMEIIKVNDNTFTLNLNNFGEEDTYYYIVYLTNLIRFNSIIELKCNVDATILAEIDNIKNNF